MGDRLLIAQGTEESVVTVPSAGSPHHAHVTSRRRRMDERKRKSLKRKKWQK